jgi:hypothetical protein
MNSKQIMKNAVCDLLYSFHDGTAESDVSASDRVYDAVFDLIMLLWGEDTAKRFGETVNATDNGFYYNGYYGDSMDQWLEGLGIAESN